MSQAQREILNTVGGEKIYFKTITSEFDEPISDYIDTNSLTFDLCSEEFRTGKIQFSEEEIKFLKSQFDLQVQINLNRISPKLNKKTSRKREEFITRNISLPVVFRGDTLALYYSSGRYGGQFNLLQKKSDTWQMACSSLVWIE